MPVFEDNPRPTPPEPGGRARRAPAPFPKQVVDASAAQSPPTTSPATYRAMRKAQPANFLLPWTRIWLDRLAPEVRPQDLARDYPRIANRFAAEWWDPIGLDHLFDDLLHDRRGGRRGFPQDVQADIIALWSLWHRRQRVNPASLG
jgi:hypothetical protein